MRIHLCQCNLYSESIKLLGIFSIAQNPIKSNRFSKFLRIMVFSSVTLIQSYNKRQNALASIKHLTPLLLPVNKGSKAFEKGKTQSPQPPPVEHHATMRFKLRSVERRRNLRTKRVCLDKSICRRPLPLNSLIQTVSVRKKRNACFYSRWGDTIEHIQLHIRVSEINVNSVSRTLQGKHKPPCIVRFHLLCRAAFFIYKIFFSEVRIIAIIVFYIILFLLVKRSFED